MQIIQSIREKGAAIIIVVIALSLVGFILMDAKQGSSAGFFGGTNDNVGKVNGEKITLAYFNKRMEEAKATEAAQNGGQEPSGPALNRINEQVWNQIVAEKIFFKETGKLGIKLTPQEVTAVLMSSDQANPFMKERGMIDPATGKLDIAKAQQAIDNIRKLKGEQREKVDAQILDPLKLSTTVSKYSGLINASAYYPAWMKERDAAEAKAFATISYVAVPYNEISDSAVTVSDTDINEYVKKHKDLFKQEAGRTVSYVSYSQNPTTADSVRTQEQLNKIKMSFAADTNAKVFTARNMSSISFSDEFLPKSKITSSSLDTILKQPAGSVYGPYVDGKNYVLAKVIGSKQLPDSTKASHILIQTADQSGQPIIEDSVAKKRADSILTAVKAGADFALLAKQYGSDATKDKGGDLGFFGYEAPMVEEFNRGAFGKPVGSTEVIRTRFGYHVIKITGEKGALPAYKIAFFGKEITPSDATINEASLAATKASAQKDRKSLEAYLKSQGKNLVQNPAIIKESDFAIADMQEARSLVRWVFGAKKGAVSEPFSIGDAYVVAALDNIYEEGTQDAATARRGAEAVIRNQKKADMIIKNLGANPTLEAAAAKYKKQVSMAGADSSITMASQLINGLGVEYKVIGAAFNKDNQAKPSVPFAGTSAVYIVKTTGIQNKPDPAPAVQMQTVQKKQSDIRNQAANWFEAMRKQAEIKDKRSNAF